MSVGIVLGAGQFLSASDLNDLIEQFSNEPGVSAQAVSSGTDTTTSASFVNMAGTGAVTSFSVTKKYTATRYRFFVAAGWSLAANGVNVAEFGVSFNGSDITCARGVKTITGDFWASSGPGHSATGAAPGVYTIQARWRRVSGAQTLQRTTNDWLAILAREVA